MLPHFMIVLLIHLSLSFSTFLTAWTSLVLGLYSALFHFGFKEVIAHVVSVRL